MLEFFTRHWGPAPETPFQRANRAQASILTNVFFGTLLGVGIATAIDHYALHDEGLIGADIFGGIAGFILGGLRGTLVSNSMGKAYLEK